MCVLIGYVYLLVCDAVTVSIISQSIPISTQFLIDIQLLPQHLWERRHDLAVAAVVHHVPWDTEKVLLVGGSRAEGEGEPGLDVAGDPRGPPLQDLGEVAVVHHQEGSMVALREEDVREGEMERISVSVKEK